MINVLWIIVIVVIVYFISHLRSLMKNDCKTRGTDLKIEFMVDQNSVYIRNSSLLSRILAKLGHSTSSLAISSAAPSSSSNASKQTHT
jgi:hypothetical protein